MNICLHYIKQDIFLKGEHITLCESVSLDNLSPQDRLKDIARNFENRKGYKVEYTTEYNIKVCNLENGAICYFSIDYKEIEL